MTEQHEQFLAVIAVIVLALLAIIAVAGAVRETAVTINHIMRRRAIRESQRAVDAFYK